MAGLIPISILLCSYLGRWVFELAAFADVSSATHELEARISEVNRGKPPAHASVIALPDGRDVDVLITDDLYHRLAAIRPPLWSLSAADKHFCLTLQAQHGHWAAVRAIVPALWDDGLNDYHDCR